MCGRYRRTTPEEELARRYHIPIPPQRDLPISWNIAPTEDVLAIRFTRKENGCVPVRSSPANRMSLCGRSIQGCRSFCHDDWLSGEAGKEILVPSPADRMKAWPISARINTPRNDDPEIIILIEVESVPRREDFPQLL